MEYLTRLKLIDQLSSINHENDALAQSLHPTEAARTSPRPVVNFYDFSRYFLQCTPPCFAFHKYLQAEVNWSIAFLHGDR